MAVVIVMSDMFIERKTEIHVFEDDQEAILFSGRLSIGGRRHTVRRIDPAYWHGTSTPESPEAPTGPDNPMGGTDAQEPR